MPDNYLEDLPTTEQLSQRLQFAFDYWRPRNDFIKDIRNTIEGNNPIVAPTTTQYKIRTMHTYLLAATINEKAARFVHQPRIQVIPEGIDPDARKTSSEMEKAIEIALFEMERLGDGDVWSRVVLDAILLDQGVERVERAQSAFWPELPKFEEDSDRVKYKKEQGLPIRSLYVPLENFYPIYEGPNEVESFELETRSLRSVMRNPLFNSGILAQWAADNKNPKTQVTIINYCNHQTFAYYALAPGGNVGSDVWPKMTPDTMAGTPVLLHSYKHNLGETLYNTVAGRFGGWKTEHNRVEGINKGMMELNQRADEILSQALTNVRARYWPSLVFKVDPEKRSPDGGAPKPLSVREGENITMFLGETLEPIFQTEHDEAVPWLFEKIQEQIGRLGGSPILFGGRQPGVETGYHQALQITQSEHLDDKIEQHLSFGAVKRATKILKHIKEMGEEVFVHYVEQVDGKKTGNYLSIKPNELSPLPRMDAQVRRPRPVDFAASLRTAREASDDRGGKGPLLDDDTIRSTILNQSAPDEIEQKILIEKQKQNILESGLLDEIIKEKLNLKLVQKDRPQADLQTALASDPALMSALQQLNLNGAPAAGGVSGATGGAVGGVPLPTGMPTGQSQPEANTGQEVAVAGGTSPQV